MHTQIIKVNDIDKAIQEVGLKYYVDRLLQDALGDYYWVETTKIDPSDAPKYKNVCFYSSKSGYSDDVEMKMAFRYEILPVPKGVAWFCIDALKLQSQVMGIGSGSYEDGPHGGKLKFVAIEHRMGQLAEAKIIPRDVVDVVRIEEL